MAGLLIRRQAEGTWIHAGQQHVVAWWDSQPEDGMSQKEKMILCCSKCGLYLFFVFFILLYLLLNSLSLHIFASFTSFSCAIPGLSTYLQFFLLCFLFLLFYLVPVNRSVVQNVVITPASVWLKADCCRETVLA